MNRAAVTAGCRVGLDRVRHPAALATGAVTILIGIALAWFERRASWYGATMRVLEGPIFGWIVPLASLFGTIRTLAGGRLDDATAPVARFGSSRRALALGLIAASALVAGLVCAVVASLAAVVAHDPTALPTAYDALTTAWVGGLTSFAYCGLFAFGSTFGRRGGGRLVALAIDLLLAGSGGVWVVLLPHAHAINLLGGDAPLALPQPVSALLLAVLGAVFAGGAVLRCAP